MIQLSKGSTAKPGGVTDQGWALTLEMCQALRTRHPGGKWDRPWEGTPLSLREGYLVEHWQLQGFFCKERMGALNGDMAKMTNSSHPTYWH